MTLVPHFVDGAEIAEAERTGPVQSPRYARFAELADRPAAALPGEPLLHTASRPLRPGPGPGPPARPASRRPG